MSGCCSPSRDPSDAPRAGGENPEVVGIDVTANLIELGAAEFRMGNDQTYGYPEDGEGPSHGVALEAFSIGSTAVTNEEFAAFVAATDYRSDAEDFGWSFVFTGLLPDDFPDTRGVASAPWWRQVEGADWAHPEGPTSSLDDRERHPAIHISWFDAVAYCAWSGTRLPTEAEWEFAARGGLVQRRFPWGDELRPDGEHRMNVFQGQFPGKDTAADGFAGTAPVGSFEPNGYGLYDMTGNVWEWTADWFDPGYYATSPPSDPKGPESGTHRTMRGGSYLCHASYCNRYRVDSRSASAPDSSTGNLGFRVAR